MVFKTFIIFVLNIYFTYSKTQFIQRKHASSNYRSLEPLMNILYLSFTLRRVALHTG